MTRCWTLLCAILVTTCSRERTRSPTSAGNRVDESNDTRPLPDVVEDSPSFLERWRPDGVSITYGRVDLEANTSRVAIPGRALTTTDDPDFEPPQYGSFADGDRRLFLSIESCGEWYENLSVIIELIRIDGAWRVHGIGMSRSTDNAMDWRRGPWLRPSTGSLVLDAGDEESAARIRCAFSLVANVDDGRGREHQHFALDARLEVPSRPALGGVPPFVRKYAEAVAGIKRE